MRRFFAAAFLAASCTLAAISAQARANFVFTLVQAGNNIDISGSGTFNTSSLVFDTTLNSVGSTLSASAGLLIVAPAGGANAWRYTGISGPSSFGPGRPPVSPLGTGDLVGTIFGTELYVPENYVSGSYLSYNGVIADETYSGIGSTPGSYIYTWGSGPTADSLTINIGVVPEPASLAMLGVPAALALLRRPRVGWPSCSQSGKLVTTPFLSSARNVHVDHDTD